MENLTVLPYLRIYFSGLNVVGKCRLETPRTTSCVTRTALDRLCPEVGRSSTLRRNLLRFMVFSAKKYLDLLKIGSAIVANIKESDIVELYAKGVGLK